MRKSTTQIEQSAALWDWFAVLSLVMIIRKSKFISHLSKWVIVFAKTISVDYFTNYNLLDKWDNLFSIQKAYTTTMSNDDIDDGWWDWELGWPGLGDTQYKRNWKWGISFCRMQRWDAINDEVTQTQNKRMHEEALVRNHNGLKSNKEYFIRGKLRNKEKNFWFNTWDKMSDEPQVHNDNFQNLLFHSFHLSLLPFPLVLIIIIIMFEMEIFCANKRRHTHLHIIIEFVLFYYNGRTNERKYIIYWSERKKTEEDKDDDDADGMVVMLVLLLTREGWERSEVETPLFIS